MVIGSALDPCTYETMGKIGGKVGGKVDAANIAELGSETNLADTNLSFADMMSPEDAARYNQWSADCANGTHNNFPGLKEADVAAWKFGDAKLADASAMAKIDGDAVIALRGESVKVDPVQQKCRSTISKVENQTITLDNNMQKGNYGEMKMDAYFEERGYKRISLDRVTDLNAPTHQGIDGVYFNPNGKPPYIIAEAKFGTSKLGNTLDGRQMSDTWINGGKDGTRLERSVGVAKADDILIEGYGRDLVNVDKNGNISVSHLDSDGKVIK